MSFANGAFFIGMDLTCNQQRFCFKQINGVGDCYLIVKSWQKRELVTLS